jgi:NAD(P)-dependent dehydrogenase (short-subunit alcohol dehydrogenase family)
MANTSPATLLSRRFPSKRAFITGAASGLGRSMAHLLARDGWTLGVLDLEREALERTVAELRAAGAANVTAYPGDVAEHEFVAASVTGFSQANQGLDVMVNNAGVAVAVRSMPPRSRTGTGSSASTCSGWSGGAARPCR